MNEIQELRDLIQSQQKQISLLTKVANKSKLARFTDNKDLGTDIRITLFQDNKTIEPQVVESWRMIKNYVKVVKGDEIVDQVIEISFGAEPENVSVIKMQLGKLKKQLETADQDKLSELNEKITTMESKLNGKQTIQMKYEDFFLLEKKIVTVKKTINDGDKMYFTFDFNGKAYEVEQKFIN